MESVKSKRVYSIDEILPYIGEFGRYQKLLDVMIFIITFPMSYHPVLMYFATLVPSWKCVKNGTICLFNGTFSSDDTLRCNLPRNEWYYVEKKEFSLVTQFDIDCNHTWILQLTISMFFVGWGVGAIITGLIADRYGRKKCIFPSVAMIFIVALITPFMPNIYLVILCRFIIGFFFPGACIQAFILISELVGTNKRPLATLIPFISYPTAWIILTLKSFLIRNWKITAIVCTLPYVFVLGFYRLVPESIRWLQLNGRTEEANQILRKIAHCNKKELPSNIILSSPNVTSKSKSKLFDIFRTRKMALQSSIQIYIWIFIALTFFGLQLASSDLEGSVYRDFVFLCIVEYPSAFTAIYTSKRFGRKKSTLIPMLIAGVACLGIAIIPERGNLKIARVILGVAGKMLISMAFHAIYIWSAEMYPTDIRATAFGVLQVSSRLGSASSPWVVGGLISFGMWIPFTVMGIASLIASALGMLLPETKEITLKESINQVGNEISDLKVIAENELNITMKNIQ